MKCAMFPDERLRLITRVLIDMRFIFQPKYLSSSSSPLVAMDSFDCPSCHYPVKVGLHVLIVRVGKLEHDSEKHSLSQGRPAAPFVM